MIKTLVTKKDPGPLESTARFYHTFKELQPIFLIQKIKIERLFSNLFYEDIIIISIISIPVKNTAKETKLQNNIYD